MGKAACLNCSIEKDVKLLKKCGGCKAVLYCSTECQRTSWRTTHKYTCVYVAPLPSLGVEDFDRRFNKIVDRWVHEWRGILERYSMAALDLANYPGRHVTHAMCMELNYTGNRAPARTFQLMNGRVRPVEDILSKQPDLRVLRDPPSLMGQRVRYVLVFNLDPSNATVRRCKVRAYAWTVPLLLSTLETLDKTMSMLFAETIFEVAKEDFDNSDPDDVRARGADPPLPLQHLLAQLPR